MKDSDAHDREIQALRDRLSRLSEASLRINETLDLELVLKEILESARLLTGAQYAVITIMNETGGVEDYLASGLSAEEARAVWEIPDGLTLFEYLSHLPEPLRGGDLAGYIRGIGLPEFRPPVLVGAFLTAPIRHLGKGVGNIYLARVEVGDEFSREDQETLVMFASQAALVIANARRYREERRSRMDLETLINTSPVGVVLFDARTGAPLYINREAYRMLGDLAGPEGDVEALLETLSFRRADGREISLEEFPVVEVLSTETVRAEEIVIGLPDGRSVTTLINATPISSEDGLLEKVMVTLQDMTPMEELERQRSEFLGLVSHELREPLTSIKGSVVNLRESLDSLDPAEILQFVRIIESQSDRMRDLIGELLDMARIEAGALSVALEPVDVIALVDEAKNAFLVSGRGRNVTIDLEPDLPWVMADRRRILQVLSNLLSNAARHSQQTSAIQVGAVLENGSVTLSVSDEGRGVEPERLPFLFRKFSRIHDSYRGRIGEREVMGSGLGLAICKGIVEAHGGRIWADSEGVGLGSTFSFTLPSAQVMVTRPSGLPSQSGRDVGEQGRILVVDDDPETLRYVRGILSEAGYMPRVTADPEEALLLFGAERPRLVLLDLLLPGSDGIELMERMLRIAEVPVVFVSAYNRDETIARALEAGAADYVVKPFSATELVARVRAALRRRLAVPPVEPPGPFVSGDLIIDYEHRRVSVKEESVQLTPTEYELLCELSINAGRVLTFSHLLERVWGPERSRDRRSLRTYVKRLRTKLEKDGSPRHIFAEPRVGYRMDSPEPPIAPIHSC